MKEEGMDAREAMTAVLRRKFLETAMEVYAGDLVNLLAEQGYVLVNVEGLAAALDAEMFIDPEHNFPSYITAAVLAERLLSHFKDDAHPA